MAMTAMTIKRRLLLGCSASSLLLCVTLAVLWSRSYRNGEGAMTGKADSFSITKTEPLYWFIAGPGKLTLCGQRGKAWDNPLPHGFDSHGFSYGGLWGDDGSLLWNVVAPFWALVLLTAILPAYEAIAFVRRRRRSRQVGFMPILDAPV